MKRFAAKAAGRCDRLQKEAPRQDMSHGPARRPAGVARQHHPLLTAEDDLLQALDQINPCNERHFLQRKHNAAIADCTWLLGRVATWAVASLTFRIDDLARCG